ncbi:MAG: DUF1538 domain-containing protein [Gammaproteobacteria bacterium]|nr:DUF1538 domain-containing protein [Gammaproteobacteria bacterium]
METLRTLMDTGLSTVWDVLPIVVIIFVFQFLVLRRPIANPAQVLAGFIYVLVGLTLFLVGLQEALFPLGEIMARQLTDPEFIHGAGAAVSQAVRWRDYYWVYLFALAIGFASAIAEPALIAVAMKAQEVSGGAIRSWGLRVAVALGCGLGVALGTYRIVTGTPLHWYIMAAYVVVIVQTLFAPRLIIALAYDSGGVTTSTVTVPLVTALGLGLAATVPGRSPLLDGFGLIAFACMFPIMTVMGYAQITEWRARSRDVAE